MKAILISNCNQSTIASSILSGIYYYQITLLMKTDTHFSLNMSLCHSELSCSSSRELFDRKVYFRKRTTSGESTRDKLASPRPQGIKLMQPLRMKK